MLINFMRYLLIERRPKATASAAEKRANAIHVELELLNGEADVSEWIFISNKSYPN